MSTIKTGTSHTTVMSRAAVGATFGHSAPKALKTQKLRSDETHSDALNNVFTLKNKNIGVPDHVLKQPDTAVAMHAVLREATMTRRMAGSARLSGPAMSAADGPGTGVATQEPKPTAYRRRTSGL